MNSLATPTSRTVFTDVSGLDSIEIKVALNGEAFLLGSTDPELRLFNTEAPAVALAILTAAGFALGNNRDDSNGSHEMVDTAAGILADAIRIGQRNQAHSELTRRRDELAVKLFDQPVYANYPGGFTYADSTEVVQAAIDMIIQLQDEAAK